MSSHPALAGFQGPVREWFLPRASGFTLKQAFTRTGAIRYTTVGALVPIREVHGAVDAVRTVALKA